MHDVQQARFLARVHRVTRDQTTIRRFVIASAVVTYLAVAVGMSLSKRPWVDEAWFAIPAVNLLEHGYMGTTTLDTAGTHLVGLDRYTYWILPLYVVVSAGWYGLVGFSVMSMRALSVVWGAVGLLCWYLIVRRLSGREAPAVLALLLVATDFIWVRGAGDGRMDVMSAALSAAALATYLAWRERHLTRAVVAANVCAAASLLTHPQGLLGVAMVGTVALLWDRRRVRWRHPVLAAVPYGVGFGAWGMYILQEPDLFLAQFGGNASGRMTGPASLVRNVVAAYGPAFGFQGHWAGPIVHLRLLILMAYLAGVVGVLFTPALRRQAGPRLLVTLTGLSFVIMAFLGGANAHDYLVHIVPLYLSCLAIWMTWAWDQRAFPRSLLALAATGLIVLQLGGIGRRIAVNQYARDYMPAVEFLQQRASPGALIMGSAELGFHLGFTPRLIDDRRLGYFSGHRPEFVVVDDRYRDWFDGEFSTEPDVQRHIRHLLSERFVLVYDRPPYSIYQSRISMREPETDLRLPGDARAARGDPFSLLGRRGGPGDDRVEAGDLQARAADQSPVHVGQRDERLDVVRFDRTAILDSAGFGRLGAKRFAESPANVLVRFAGFGRRGVLAGADGPHGFVREDQAGNLAATHAVEAARDLAVEHRQRLARLPLLQRLTDADNRHEVGREGGAYLPVDRLVGLAEHPSPFRVAEDHVARTRVFEHVGADLAGKRAFALVIHVLGRDANPRVASRLSRRG